MSLPHPISLIAERAVRYLRNRRAPVDSVHLAQQLLSMSTADEATAKRVLESAFAGDSRLVYQAAGWTVAPGVRRSLVGSGKDRRPEPDRALIFVDGRRPGPQQPYELRMVSVLRLSGDEVLAACGGELVREASNKHLRKTILENLTGATLVIHDPPGSLRALEEWLGEPLDVPVSLRRLGQIRLGLSAGHSFEDLASRLGLSWTESEDPLHQADALDACLGALQAPGESLHDLREQSAAGAPPIDWSRLAFDRTFLRRVPAVPGTYQFFDKQGRSLYVGKSKNLNQRINSYFREGTRRTLRVQRLLDDLHRIEYEHSGSDLEAVLREAEQIREKNPRANVQRAVHTSSGRGKRLKSILILETAESPAVLRAYLVCRGRLVGRVSIGPRGGGLARVERLLEDHFFLGPDGPSPAAGSDVDVELIVRWLASNRDRAVAFDPTTLQSAQEVTERLRWFLGQGSPFDTDGSPVFTR